MLKKDEHKMKETFKKCPEIIKETVKLLHKRKKKKEFLFIVTVGELERIQLPSLYKYCFEINVRREIS